MLYRKSLRTRRGVSTLEMLLAFPVLLIASFAIFQFGVVMVVHQTAAEAVNEGARAAARESNPIAAREASVAAVNRVLAVHGLAVTPAAAVAASGSGVHFALEYPTGAVVAVQEAGDSAVTCSLPAVPMLTPLDRDVRATLCVSLAKAPLLNLLPSFGFDAMGKQLHISAMAGKE